MTLPFLTLPVDEEWAMIRLLSAGTWLRPRQFLQVPRMDGYDVLRRLARKRLVISRPIEDSLRARIATLEEAVRWAYQYGPLLDTTDPEETLHWRNRLMERSKMEPSVPCPHGRASWKMCPHCNGINSAGMKEGE